VAIFLARIVTQNNSLAQGTPPLARVFDVNIMGIMFPQLSFSPTVNVNRQPKDKEQSTAPLVPQSTNDLSFVLMVIALMLMSAAVLAMSSALLVHAAKS
jgi:hypothetical protein